MAGRERCALCDELREIRRSHIMGRWVNKHLKEMDLGERRQQVRLLETEDRVQDPYVARLFCDDCEGALQVGEARFINNVFREYQKSIKDSLLRRDCPVGMMEPCDEWHAQFFDGLALRIVLWEQRQGNPAAERLLTEMGPRWRLSILDPKCQHVSGCQRILIRLPLLFQHPDDSRWPFAINWYLHRTADPVVEYEGDQWQVLCKFPGVCVVLLGSDDLPSPAIEVRTFDAPGPPRDLLLRRAQATTAMLAERGAENRLKVENVQAKVSSDAFARQFQQLDWDLYPERRPAALE